MRQIIRTVALALALLLLALPAIASDKITLKDGRSFEGTVLREESGYVWFKVKVGGLENQMLFKPDEISKLEKDTAPAPVPDPTIPKNGDPANSPRHTGAPK